MNSITYFVQNFMNIIFSPLIIFSGIYITALAIYSIKGKKSPNYIYNINFFGYILGITVTSVVLSFSLISLILVIKNKIARSKRGNFIIIFIKPPQKVITC